MIEFFKKYKLRILFLLLLSGLILYAFNYALTPKRILKVLAPTDFDPSLVHDSMLFVKKYHKIAPFKLINQNGDIITQDDYIGKIYVADFFFTTCPTICPIMTKNMRKLQDAFVDNPEVMFLSHSVTPEADTPAVLKEYGERNGVLDGKWNLVTGDKEKIYNLARKSYLAVKDAPYGGNYDMIHTENFLLIDKEGRLRERSYDGTNPEEIDVLIEDIQVLIDSYKKE